MSYILDALRRADTERDRGLVPTLHARPVNPEAADVGRSRGGFPLLRTGLVVTVLAVLAVLGLLGWRALERDGARDAGVSVTPPAPAPVSLPASASGPASAPPSTAATASSPRAPPASAAGATALEPIPPPKKVDKPVQRAETPPAAQAPPAARAPPGESRVYSPTELPADVQHALPRLVVGGASYSDNPASRMLILNGQVFHEGDSLGPDLSLEQIKLKTAVLRYKGYRYGISY